MDTETTEPIKPPGVSAAVCGNSTADPIPAAACPRCGGWTASGGMSQHSGSIVPVSGRTGCSCHLPLKPIEKGNTVRWKAATQYLVNATMPEGREAWYRVTAVIGKGTKATVNLGAIFGGRIYAKRVPVADVTEDYDNWYAMWSRSEAYQSM